MRAKRIMLALALLAAPLGAWGQGFADLGSQAQDFTLPSPDPVFVFPRDHGPHRDFRIEWWYLTANLTGADGVSYGVQWTLFRTALQPGGAPDQGWSSPQIWLGHAAVTSPDWHHFAQRAARGGIGVAGAQAHPFTAWIDDWRMTSRAAPEDDSLSALDLTARGNAFHYALSLTADAPLVFHGDSGYSVKSRDGQASYYYAQPAYRASGQITVNGVETDVTGIAWLDREWSSQPLSREQEGWDWFALTFDSDDKLMIARVRSEACDGKDAPQADCEDAGFVFGAWMPPAGASEPIDPTALRLTPQRHARVAGRDIPVRWRIELPNREVDIVVEALNPQSWMGVAPPYWEGPVAVSGTHAGRGYLEMTGYPQIK